MFQMRRMCSTCGLHDAAAGQRDAKVYFYYVVIRHYLLFGAFLQGDPVLPVRADVHLVGLDKVNLVRLLGNGALGADGGDEAQEPEVHLRRAKREELAKKRQL